MLSLLLRALRVGLTMDRTHFKKIIILDSRG